MDTEVNLMLLRGSLETSSFFIFLVFLNTWLLKLYKNNSTFFVYLDEHAPFWVIFNIVYQSFYGRQRQDVCFSFYLFINVTLIPL
jgi:hypothetical protein